MLTKLFQKQKMATKRAPRAPILASTSEFAIIFRGESVSGHPGTLRGKKKQNRPENKQKQNKQQHFQTSPIAPPPAPSEEELRKIARDVQKVSAR